MSDNSSASPNWSSTTKLIVGLSFVAVSAALVITFRSIIGPLILAFMLAYLLLPVISRMSQKFKLSWRMSVNLLYVIIILLLIGSFTAAGLAIIQQMQSLIGFIQRNVTAIPDLVTQLSSQSYQLGPFVFSLAQYDLTSLIDQILAAVQPALGQAGSLIGSFASGAAVTISWSLFVLLISYFLLAESRRVSDELVSIDIPGYSGDVRRLGEEVRKIWNSFLRGQLIIILLVILSYAIMMSILGVRYALVIAILAGLARFVPYLGPLVLWVVAILVSYFQGSNYFGISQIYYALLVVGLGFLLDQIFDNIVSPRVLGQSLGVHPAALLVMAIVATRLIGLIGLVLAAPVLATIILFSRYMLRKMLDADPWQGWEGRMEPVEIPWAKWSQTLRGAWLKITALFGSRWRGGVKIRDKPESSQKSNEDE
ncbi:MAG: AI-2E family transporter [Anaerolineales bacterium]|nr:AI-2E family transporter [Anaerolineales bacterium]